MVSKNITPKLVVTMGDINGIGPEIIAKLIYTSDKKFLDNLIFIGSFEILIQYINKLFPNKIDINKINCWVDIDLKPQLKPGQITKEAGQASLEAIYKAHELCIKNPEIIGMVTCPISKEAIRLAGSEFTGHTDMLKSLAKVNTTRMVMVYNKFIVALSTLHIPWKEVPNQLTINTVYTTILLAHQAFSSKLNPYPKIAVAGLNPHAGENGLLGREEIEIIIPAIQEAKKFNPNISGPYPADSLFKYEMRKQTDIFIAQTHDQGLIAIKTLGGIKCVNVTLGLPYIRTSVGHGTAFDIAGKGIANHIGLKYAINWAFRLFKLHTTKN